jgi:DegV family protein with EDD domain
MARIAVVTDSSVCLPAGLVEDLGIHVLPVTVHLPGADRPDGDHDLASRVYQALEDDRPVKSSPPSVAEYLAAIEDADADAVVVVTPATEYTAMARNALMACELATKSTVVVDSRTGAAGQGLVAVAGAQAAADGGTLETVIDTMRKAAARVDLVGALAGLTALRRSGRVPSHLLDRPRLSRHSRQVAAAGREVRSVFRMRGGAIESLASVESAAEALDLLEEEWRAGGGQRSDLGIVFHGDADDLAADLTRRLGGVSIVAGFSAAMGIYTGRGVVGVAWLPPA